MEASCAYKSKLDRCIVNSKVSINDGEALKCIRIADKDVITGKLV